MRNVALMLVMSLVCLGPFEKALAQESQGPVRITMTQLLADPFAFHERRIAVVGFLQLEFEGNGLFRDRNDQINKTYRNGIAIDLASRPKASLNHRYVLLEGTFDAKARGHRGIWSGKIKKISKAIEWPSSE